MARQTRFPITALHSVAHETWALRFTAADIARQAKPGQFVNILTSDSLEPLLRRPYSVSDVEGDEVGILFSLVGKGTHNLAALAPGREIDVIGPLGNTFSPPPAACTVVLLAGGIGVAPFPFLVRSLAGSGCRIESFIGARSAERLCTAGLPNPHTATDDGSAGWHGTVVDCLGAWLPSAPAGPMMLYACGPTPMLAAVQRFALERNLPCELSLESEMACGIGICQGCPVEHHDHPRKYALVCTDGPCFDARSITFREHVR